MAYRRKPESGNLGPIWRRSLLECDMRSRTTGVEVAVVVVFLIVAIAVLVYVLPGFLGRG